MTSEKTQDKKREEGEWPQGEEAVSGCTPTELAWPVQGGHNGRTWVWTSAQECLIHLPRYSLSGTYCLLSQRTELDQRTLRPVLIVWLLAWDSAGLHFAPHQADGTREGGLCWKRISMGIGEGHRRDMTTNWPGMWPPTDPGAGLGHSEAPHPFPCHLMWVPLSSPAPRGCFKDTALR